MAKDKKPPDGRQARDEVSSRETRVYGDASLRQTDGKTKICGYAAKYNLWSLDLGGFREMIKPGAFDNALKEKQDVRGLGNHLEWQVLGRSTVATMTLTSDDIGLYYEIDPPDTSYARDLITSIERGDISQSSFAFAVRANGSVWKLIEDPNGNWRNDRWERELSDLDLFDVSPVTFPAYPDTTVAIRSLQEERQRRNRPTVGESRKAVTNQLDLRLRLAVAAAR